MYPTPPSHETNKSHSPETMTESMNEAILTGAPSVAYHNTVESSIQPERIDPITNVKVGPLQVKTFCHCSIRIIYFTSCTIYLNVQFLSRVIDKIFISTRPLFVSLTYGTNSLTTLRIEGNVSLVLMHVVL